MANPSHHHTMPWRLAILTVASAFMGAQLLASEPAWVASLRAYDLSFEGNSTGRVWLGVTNQTSAPHAVCLESIWYSFDLGEEGVEGGSGKTMSPGQCDAPQSAQLVLPGETAFRMVFVKVPNVAAGTTLQVTVGVSGVAKCPSQEDCKVEEFSTTVRTEWRLGPRAH